MPWLRSNVLIYLVRKYPQANAILCSTGGIPEKYRKVLKCWVGIKALLGSPIFRCIHHLSRCENLSACKYDFSNPCKDMEGSLWVSSWTFFSQMVLSPHGFIRYSLQKLTEASSFLSLRKFTKPICAPAQQRMWPLEKPHFWSAASSLWCRSHLFALTTCQKDWISARWEQIWDPICQFAARVYSRCLYFAYISMLFYEISNSNFFSLVGAAKSECWNGKALPSQFI